MASHLAVLLAGVLLATAGYAIAGGTKTQQTSVTDGVRIDSVRPTGVGLPLVGAHGTVGAGDYAAPLKNYHDSGAYRKDLRVVKRDAQRFLRKRLQRRARKCKKPRRKHCGKKQPAMVLDIDETSLSNYSFLAPTNFSNPVVGLAGAIAAANTPAIAPTLKLFDWARSKGVAVFFITGRPGSIPGVRDQTIANLKRAGYSGWERLYLNDEGEPTKEYKSGKRAEIQRDGYKILLNVGDQESDLSGGYAVRGFKLPNPYYFIGDE